MGKKEIYLGDTTQGIWLKFTKDSLWVAGQLRGEEIPHKPVPWAKFDQARKDSRLEEEPTLYERYKRENTWNSDAPDMRSFKMAIEFHFHRDQYKLAGRSFKSRNYEAAEEHAVLLMGDEVIWDFGPLNHADDMAYTAAFRRFEESLDRIRERVRRCKTRPWYQRLAKAVGLKVAALIVLYTLVPSRYTYGMNTKPLKPSKAVTAVSAVSAPIKRASDKTRDELKARFLEVFKERGFINRAAKKVGVDRDTVTNWRNSDPVFAAAFNDANEEVTEAFEETLDDLAKGRRTDTGFLVPNSVDTTALIFALKARAPKKYTERFRHEVSNGQMENVISEMIALVKRGLPDNCPHCKTNLQLRASLANQLVELSERLEKPQGKAA